MQMLAQAGYRVKSQWPVGTNHIDLVVEGAGKRLALECDGDRWCPQEQLAEDMTRQAILERLGWRFSRIRGSQFFRDPERTLEALLARLRLLDIPPEDRESGAAPTEEETALQDRIILRAAELRQEWAAHSDEEDSQPKPGAARSWGQPWRRTVVVEEPTLVPAQDGLIDLDHWAPPPPMGNASLTVHAQPAVLAPPIPSFSTATMPPEEALPATEGAFSEPLFFPGDYARHERYGVGRVVSSRMVGDFELVEVDFANSFGRKTLEAKLTRLEKVPNSQA
jgi:very-short-patch-repair endonuclease